MQNIRFFCWFKKGNVSDILKIEFYVHCVASIEKEMSFDVKDIYVGINSVDFNFQLFVFPEI